jgi:hypothetical protein
LIITGYDSFGPKYSYLRVDGRGFNSTLSELEEVWVEFETSGAEKVIAGQNCGPQFLDFGPQFWLWNFLLPFLHFLQSANSSSGPQF